MSYKPSTTGTTLYERAAMTCEERKQQRPEGQPMTCLSSSVRYSCMDSRFDKLKVPGTAARPLAAAIAATLARALATPAAVRCATTWACRD